MTAPPPVAIPSAAMLRPEIALAAIPDDERVWVPQAPGVEFRPLFFNTVIGQWLNLLRVRRSGIISRHRHPGAVFGYVLAGKWHYYEHPWVAEAGHFVYEPPGEIHTLAVPEDCDEMITFFNISGAMIYVDEAGHQSGYEDVYTKIEMCRAHYTANGLGAEFVDQFVC
jgi:2,4'-dihydroxyacetophenone dioxygenase